MAFAWAKNNAKKIFPSNRLTAINAYVRRTSNMLSSALRYGTTDHMLPDKSTSNGQGVKWKPGKHGYNIAQLARRERDQVFAAIPELERLTFDFASGKFTDENGDEINAADIGDILESDRTRSYDKGIGATTALRALITDAALREFDGATEGVADIDHGGRGAVVADATGGGALYAHVPPDRAQIEQTAAATLAPAVREVEGKFLDDSRHIYASLVKGRRDSVEYFAPGAADVLTDGELADGQRKAAVRDLLSGMKREIDTALGEAKDARGVLLRKQFVAELLPTAARLNATDVDDATLHRAPRALVLHRRE